MSRFAMFHRDRPGCGRSGAGLILLVAMIGAVVLTLRHRPGVRRQDVGKQVGRKRSQGVELKDVPKGQGLENVG